MRAPTIRQFTDLDRLSQAAARDVLGQIERALAKQKRFALVLAGGSTPRRLYELIAQSPQRDRIDWTRVEFFWGDERCVAPDHADSNYRMASEAMLAALRPPEQNLHRFRGEATDVAQAAIDYSDEIARCFEAAHDGPPPSFDLVLLGLGSDGHTASLFPGSEALTATGWAAANYVAKLNAWRLTLTASILSAAKQVLFLAAGIDKADAFAAIMAGNCDKATFPALLIQPQQPVIWYVDTNVTSKLPRRLDTETAEVSLPDHDFPLT